MSIQPVVTPFDRVVAFAQDAGGARNIAGAFDVGAQYLLLLPALSESLRESLEIVQKTGSNTSSLFVFPDLITNSYDFCCSLVALGEAVDDEVGGAFQKTIIDGLKVVNAGTEALGYAHDVCWIDIGKTATPVCAIFNVTTCITDGWEAFDEIYKMEKYQKKIENAPEHRDYYESKLELAQLTIIKDVTSVAMAVIGLLSLVLGALVVELYVMMPIMLGLSTVCLAARILSCFYAKIVEEQKQLKILTSQKV
jgi:hypothetical protein